MNLCFDPRFGKRSIKLQQYKGAPEASGARNGENITNARLKKILAQSCLSKIFYYFRTPKSSFDKE